MQIQIITRIRGFILPKNRLLNNPQRIDRILREVESRFLQTSFVDFHKTVSICMAMDWAAFPWCLDNYRLKIS